jgi:ABC-type amino acid transport substrate-binding protein
MNAKRLEVMDFTVPVYFYGDGLIVKQGNPNNLHTWQDLAGHVVGAERGENYADWLDKRTDLKDVKLYKSFSEEIQDLVNGGVDAIIGELPVFAYYAKVHAGSIEVASGYIPQTNLADWTRFGVRKEDNDLNNAFSHALMDIVADGTALSILERYGMSVDNLTPRART